MKIKMKCERNKNNQKTVTTSSWEVDKNKTGGIVRRVNKNN